MGLGEDPLGAPRLGLDATPRPERGKLAPIAAKIYNPKTKSFEVNQDGQYGGQHPVDQFVVMNCTLVLGTIRSAKSFGNPAQTYPVIGPREIDRVRKRILQSLSPKVASGELRVHNVVVVSSRGRTLVGVDYTNLVTARRRDQIFGN